MMCLVRDRINDALDLSKEIFKEDMISDAIVKMIKNIYNYKPEFKDKCFNY